MDIHKYTYSQMYKDQPRKYQKIAKIGEGAYGAVYKAIDIEKGTYVALKVTRFDSEDEGIPSTTLREISILRSLNHPNIVKLLDVLHYADKDQYVIELVFEYMDEDLGKFIKNLKDKPLDEGTLKKVFKDIVEGVRYLHNRKVFHRDLKPQNILINTNKEIKIADFGLSRVIIDPNRTFSKEIETLWYRSPELLLGIRHYDSGIDIWSLGCILYELAERKVLFRGDSEVTQIFIIFEVLGTPRVAEWPNVVTLPYFKTTFPKMKPKGFECQNLTGVGVDLLSRLIEINPQKRMTVNQILNHPFFKPCQPL